MGIMFVYGEDAVPTKGWRNSVHILNFISIFFMIRRFIEYLRRMPRTRGFGVQSPTAYTFLRHVVKESGFLRTHTAQVNYPYGASHGERLLYRLQVSYPQVFIIKQEQWSKLQLADTLLDKCGSDTVLVLQDINCNRLTAAMWRQIVEDNRCFQVFDMVDIGVVFFDSTKPKQLFKVNY